MLSLNQQKSYRSFINDRDLALEHLLRVSRLRKTDYINGAFRKVFEIIQLNYDRLAKTSSRQLMNSFEDQIEQVLNHLAFMLTMETIELRKKAYMLSYAGEAQAIAQNTAKSPKLSLSKSKLDEVINKPFENGLSPMKTFQLQFSMLRREISNALEYSLAFGEPVDKALGRIWYKLPDAKTIPGKRVLKTVKMTENSRPAFSAYAKGSEEDAFDLSLDRQRPVHGFEWDQETWDQLLEDLSLDYQFTNRSPESYVDVTNPYNDLPVREDVPEEDRIYAWEIESETTHDFVQQVRDGQMDAAKKNGITDFVWIAILDDRTDHCCEWRSGLLTSEIEEKLKTDHKDDKCRAIVPPAHFNCRCTLAPVSPDLEAVDNTDIDRSFDAWLES